MTDKTTIKQLTALHGHIIDAVIKKAARVCPGALDIVAVTGSYASGDFYEYSDLDLLIVINDDAGFAVSDCFICDGIGYDIYCHTWERLEYSAEYTDPYVSKLLDSILVYTSGSDAEERFNNLGKRLAERMETPNYAVIMRECEEALSCLGRIMLCGCFGDCRLHAAGILHHAANIVYLANGEYVRHGVKGMPDEMYAMKRLPDGFPALHRAVIDADDTESLRAASVGLMRSLADFADALCGGKAKQPANADALGGTYEEAWSNWRNKMHRAASTGDRYLSLMSLAACHKFYGEIAESVDIQRFSLTDALGNTDTKAAAERFDDVLREYGEQYDIRNFGDIQGFITDYLK